MERDFWHDTWREDRLGFHRDRPHGALLRHWPELAAGTRVLVPLCGKSLDLPWLAALGMDVTGVEWVEKAARALFDENAIPVHRNENGGYPAWRAEDRALEVVVADFMAWAEAMPAGSFDALYDRAALVALPADMRPAYVAACRRLLRDDARGLVVTFEYDPAQMDGPPFNVPPEEVRALWDDLLVCEERVDRARSRPPGAPAGPDPMHECTWVLGDPAAGAGVPMG